MKEEERVAHLSKRWATRHSPVIPASAGIHAASPVSLWPRVGARCQHPSLPRHSGFRRNPRSLPGVSMAESWGTMPACPIPRHPASAGIHDASPVSLWPRVGLRCQHAPSPVIPASAGIHVASPMSVCPRVGVRCQHPPSPVIPASAGIHVASPMSVCPRVGVKAHCMPGCVWIGMNGLQLPRELPAGRSYRLSLRVGVT